MLGLNDLDLIILIYLLSGKFEKGSYKHWEPCCLVQYLLYQNKQHIRITRRKQW